MEFRIISGFIFLCLFNLLAAHKILDEVPLIDGHNDLPNNLYLLLQNDLSKFKFDKNLTSDPVWGSNCSSCFTDLPRLKQGKVGAQFWVAYVDCQTQNRDALAKTLEQIDVIKRLIEKYPNDLELVTNADGITSAFRKKKIASLIAVEGGHSIDSRLAILRIFYDLGVRYMTLTHNCNTPWADCSLVDLKKPKRNLTEFGKMVVREMNRLGMMIDLSHVSHEVMNQAILISKAPVIFSHSGAYHITNHTRNVHNDTLQLLKRNQGIIMVNFYPGFINNNASNASIHDVVKHLNFLADYVGVNYIGIGADYDGVTSQPKGLEDVSKYPELFTLLQKQNLTRWNNETLKKLASGNFIRVFKEVEKVKASLMNDAPDSTWIPEIDLYHADDPIQLWKCRTNGNNSSPNSFIVAYKSIKSGAFVNLASLLTVVVSILFTLVLSN